MYDVAIIGAGVVGCALAYKLSRYQLRVVLIDKNYDVGEGTSKGNSAIVHTGFDAPVGTLEAELVRTASKQWPVLAEKLKIPFQACGALLCAISDEQQNSLDGIMKKAIDNGVDDIEMLTASQAKDLETNVASDIRAGLLVPREAIADPFALSIACAEVALQNGVDILLGIHVLGVEDLQKPAKKIQTDYGGTIKARIIVNAAGLGTRRLTDQYGGEAFDINPRRGQFLIYDKCSRSLVNRILLPIPTAHSKGVLVIPTIFGNLMAGPTAEDFSTDDPDIVATSTEALEGISKQVCDMLPALKNQPAIATYAGVRCNCQQGSYIIRYDDGASGIVTVTGIRSTGFTSAPALADHLIENLLKRQMLSAGVNPDAVDSRPDSRWPGWWSKPYSKPELMQKSHDYGNMICTCENISKAEILDALESPLHPVTLDAVKRRTRARMGRCQGFECGLQIAEMISSYHNIPLHKVTKRGPDFAN